MQEVTKLPIKRILATVISIAFLVFTYVEKDFIIINQHYRTWVTCTRIAWALLILSVCALAVSFARILIHARKNKEQSRVQQEQERVRSKERKLKGSNEIVEYLQNLRKILDQSKNAYKLIEQLREMDGYQERLDNLFEINEMDVFQNIVPAFQQVEDEMCDSCRSAINHYIAGGEAEFITSSEKVIKENDRRLKKVQEVLTALADYTSGQASQDSVGEVLDGFIQALATIR